MSCSHYQIAVVFLPDGTLPARSPDVAFPSLDSFKSYDEVDATGSETVAYIAAEFSVEKFPPNSQFVIGDNNQPNDQSDKYTNGPLQGGSSYTFFLRVYPKLMTEVMQHTEWKKAP